MPVQSEHPNGEFDLILSTEDLDRDGEELHVEDWATLPEHLHFDTDHAFNRHQSVPYTAGSGVPRIENNQLMVRGTYAGTEHGQLTRQLVNEGHIRTASVAYTEHKDGKRELLNGSFVGVAANPKAKILSSKAAKTSGSPAGDSPTDTPPGEADQDDDMPSHDDLVQAAHDALVHLGAECVTDDQTGESDGANKSYTTLTRLLGEAVLKAAKPNKSSGKSFKPERVVFAGSPQESTDATAAAVKTATAADESADDAAHTRAGLRAYLLKKSMERLLDET